MAGFNGDLTRGTDGRRRRREEETHMHDHARKTGGETEGRKTPLSSFNSLSHEALYSLNRENVILPPPAE